MEEGVHGEIGCYDDESRVCPPDSLVAQADKIRESNLVKNIEDDNSNMQIESSYLLDPDNSESILGRGAFGVTRKMFCTIIDSFVAVKVIDILRAEDNGVPKGSLVNEVKILQKLIHPYIVRYLGCFNSRQDMDFNVVMELVSGGSLDDKITDSSVSLKDVVKWWNQIASALSYMHFEVNVQHRDIKPANILLTEDNNVKIIDLGMASMLRLNVSKMSIVGTTTYFSYEKALGKAYNGNDDVWATGCVIIELMTKARLIGPLYMFHDAEINARLLELIFCCSSINPQYGQVIASMLDTNPTTRCSSSELVKLLNDAAAELLLEPLPEPVTPSMSREFANSSSSVVHNETSTISSLTDTESNIYPQKAITATQPTSLIQPPKDSGLSKKRNWSMYHEVVVNTLYGSFSSFISTDSSKLVTKRVSDLEIQLWIVERPPPREFKLFDLSTFKPNTSFKPLKSYKLECEFMIAGFISENRLVMVAKNFVGILNSDWTHMEEVLCDNSPIQVSKFTSLTVTLDGTYVCASLKGGVIQVWNLIEKRVCTMIEHKSEFNTIDIDPTGQLIASGSDLGSVKVWNSNGSLRRDYRGHEKSVLSLKFNYSGTRLASGSADATVAVWDVDTAEKLFTLSKHTGDVKSVFWSFDGSIILSSSADTTVYVWDGSSGAFVQKLKGNAGHSISVDNVCMSLDGRIIVSSSRLSMRIWT